jgi:ATP-binding cassette subfamily B protein
MKNLLIYGIVNHFLLWYYYPYAQTHIRKRGLGEKKVKKKKEKVDRNRIIKNNIYILKLLTGVSRPRVAHAAVSHFLFYFEWIFYSAFFIRFVIQAVEKNQSFSRIMVFLLITMAVFCSLSVYANYYENVVKPLTDTDIYKGLYRKLYRKALNTDLQCYEDNVFYNKYTMALDGASNKACATIDNIWSIIFGGIAAVLAFIIMYQIDPYALLFVIFPIIGNFVFGAALNKLTYRMYEDQTPYNRKAEYINRVVHLADYAKEVRLTRVFRLMMQKYRAAVQGNIDVVRKYSLKGIFASWFRQMFTFTIIFEGVLLYGAYRTIVTKSMQLSEYAVLSSFMVSTTWILIGFSTSMIESYKNSLYLENIRKFLEYQPKIPEDYDGIIPDPDISTIEFRNVSFGYDEGKPIIRNLSFTIKGNSKVALVGHNGAGKSTIIKLLFRFYDPTEGAIYLNGRDIKEYNLQAYRKLFTAAFQDYKIFAMTVKENVLMRRAGVEDEEKVRQALIKAGVYDKVMSLPKGMDTILTREFDENGAVLSGGQYQKIVVARAFVSEAPIRIFDEPSSALDPIAEYELFESIMQDSQDKTMVFISHRLSSVQNADMVFMLEQGRLIEQGTHKELMKSGGAYADMYKKQAENYLALEEDADAGDREEYAGSIFTDRTRQGEAMV